MNKIEIINKDNDYRKIKMDESINENNKNNELSNNNNIIYDKKENNENINKNDIKITDENNTISNEKVDDKLVHNEKLTKKQEAINFIKFVFFSISAGIIQTISFTLLKELCNFSYWPSYLIALVLSVIYNFTINRKFTFKSANNVPKAMLLVLAYYVVFTPLSTWWGNALTNIGWNEYLVLFGTMVINMITEFLWWRYVIFNKSINTAKKRK